MSPTELSGLAIDITEDRVITDLDELASIASIVVMYVTTDKRVESKPKDGELWIYHKESV